MACGALLPSHRRTRAPLRSRPGVIRLRLCWSAARGSGNLARVKGASRSIGLLLSLACLAPACSARHNRGASPGSASSSSTAHTMQGLATCAARSRFGVGGASNEIRGTSRDASLWGLALGPGHVPPRPGDELKIVWRMTGSGPLHVAFDAPDGTTRPLVFGPEPHDASSYRRPGDEWGAGHARCTAPNSP